MIENFWKVDRKPEKMSGEEESLLPSPKQTIYGSVSHPVDGQEDKDGEEGQHNDLPPHQHWVSRHKILTAAVISVIWAFIALTIFLVLFLKVSGFHSGFLFGRLSQSHKSLFDIMTFYELIKISSFGKGSCYTGAT